MKFRFWLVTGFSAIFLESWAAYFSIFGLSSMYGKVFLGAAVAIEFAKITLVNYTYSKKRDASRIVKICLWAVVIGTMLLTSAGVYGFLINSYQQKQGKVFNINAIKTNFNSKNIDLAENEIKMYEDQMIVAKERLKTLNNSRASQEKRLSDSMTTLNYRFINSLRADITKTDTDVVRVSDEISVLISKIQQKNIELGKIQQSNFEIEQTNNGVDVGPFRWIGITLGKSMDSVINYLTIFIMFLLDPTAIMLFIITNNQIAKLKTQPENENTEEQEREEKRLRRLERKEKRKERQKSDLEDIFYEEK